MDLDPSTLPDFPTCPADLPHTVGLRALLDAHHAHGLALCHHNHGIRVLDDMDVAAHAVAELAVTHALVERLLAPRWCAVRDALMSGDDAESCAIAMGVDADEVIAGLRSWAANQCWHGLIDDDDHDAVLALVEDECPAPDVDTSGDRRRAVLESDPEPADPLAEVAVGDPDPTPDDPADSCGAASDRDVWCTRAPHPLTWRHVAGDGITVVAVWTTGGAR